MAVIERSNNIKDLDTRWAGNWRPRFPPHTIDGTPMGIGGGFSNNPPGYIRHGGVLVLENSVKNRTPYGPPEPVIRY
jgi:hypothetical protein